MPKMARSRPSGKGGSSGVPSTSWRSSSGIAASRPARASPGSINSVLWRVKNMVITWYVASAHRIVTVPRDARARGGRGGARIRAPGGGAREHDRRPRAAAAGQPAGRARGGGRGALGGRGARHDRDRGGGGGRGGPPPPPGGG